MTPEEIEELRALAGRLSGTAYNENLAAILGAALERIHKQEEQLDNTRAVLSQVAALQEIAVGLVATSEYETENWSMRMIPWEEISVEWAEHYKNKARRQLAEEHPEAFR